MILVTGTSGLVGSEVVRQLAAQRVPVRALVREPGRRPARRSGEPVHLGFGLEPRPGG